MLWRDRTTLCNFLVEIFILSRHVSSLAEAMSWHLHNGLINIGQRGAAPLFSVRLGSGSNELPMLALFEKVPTVRPSCRGNVPQRQNRL